MSKTLARTSFGLLFRGPDLLSVWSPSISRTFLQAMSDQPLAPRDHCRQALLLAVE